MSALAFLFIIFFLWCFKIFLLFHLTVVSVLLSLLRHLFILGWKFLNICLIAILSPCHMLVLNWIFRAHYKMVAGFLRRPSILILHVFLWLCIRHYLTLEFLCSVFVWMTSLDKGGVLKFEGQFMILVIIIFHLYTLMSLSLVHKSLEMKYSLSGYF